MAHFQIKDLSFSYPAAKGKESLADILCKLKPQGIPIAANPMSRHIFPMAVTAEDVARLRRQNREDAR